MTAINNRLVDMETNFVKQIMDLRERIDAVEQFETAIKNNEKVKSFLDIFTLPTLAVRDLPQDFSNSP